MKKKLINLQRFAEGGGDGAVGAAGSEGGTAGIAEIGAVAQPMKPEGGTEDSVFYGKPESNEETAPQDKVKEFEKMIKGDYKKEFQDRVQGIINDRFKADKAQKEQIGKYESMMSILSERYGIDAKDIDSITKAIEEDEKYLRDEAIEKGLTVNQLKEIKALQRENEAFRKARETAEAQTETEKTIAAWQSEAEALKTKYGLDSFDLNTEAMNNPEFVSLLRSGVSVESAYKAIHFDDLMGGAMAHTAQEVRKGIANSIGQRNARPSENSASSKNNATFKTDVNQLTKADRDRIDRLVARGADIRF